MILEALFAWLVLGIMPHTPIVRGLVIIGLVALVVIVVVRDFFSHAARLQDSILGVWELVSVEDPFDLCDLTKETRLEFCTDGTLNVTEDDDTRRWTWARHEDGWIGLTHSIADIPFEVLYKADVPGIGNEVVLSGDEDEVTLILRCVDQKETGPSR